MQPIPVVAVAIAAALAGLAPMQQTSAPPVRLCTELAAGQKGAALLRCKWKKRTLSVRFLEGDPAVHARVQQYANEWSGHSGLHFVFGNEADADIRVSFAPGRSESYVGTCRPALGPNDSTMNFGWLTPSTGDAEMARVVLHEFGHAIGLVHEHLSPAAGINWNRQAVYDHYQRHYGWDRARVDQNLFEKYADSQTNYTAFDPRSIMIYSIPKELTTDGYSVSWNAQLSDTDKRFIGQIYPK